MDWGCTCSDNDGLPPGLPPRPLDNGLPERQVVRRSRGISVKNPDEQAAIQEMENDEGNRRREVPAVIQADDIRVSEYSVADSPVCCCKGDVR